MKQVTYFLFLLTGWLPALASAQDMPIVFEGKACFVDKIDRSLAVGSLMSRSMESVASVEGNSRFLRVQGVFVPGPETWKEEERVRVPWPIIPIMDGSREAKSYSIVNFLPRELNARFQKPSPDDRVAPVNRLEIDSVFAVPADWKGGVFSFDGKVLKIPALDPPNSITRKEPRLAIAKAELVDEVTFPGSNLQILKPKPKSIPETVRPLDGKFLAIHLDELKGSTVLVHELSVETPTGARRGCHIYADVRDDGRLYMDDFTERRNLSPGRFGLPPILYFVVPAETTKFVLHAGDQSVEGEVTP